VIEGGGVGGGGEVFAEVFEVEAVEEGLHVVEA
jgi:hypothetical protein